jgi:DNA-binding LytR/AlgR family response regulator
MPWFALLEWAKRPAGRAATRTPGRLAAVLLAVAAASILAELAVDVMEGGQSAPVALLVMRRLPAIAATVLLIALSRRTGNGTRADRAVPEELIAIAATIDWVEAADNYVALRVDGRTAMRRMTMREAEQALAAHGFVRIHRRFLVNTSRVAGVRGNGKAYVRLADGTELPVGQAYRDNLRAPH